MHRILILIASLGLLAAIACTAPAAAPTPADTAKAATTTSGTAAATTGNTVNIQTFQFQPAALTIPVGTTVTWTNNDDIDHSVTARPGSPAMFDSGLFGKGKTFSHTFTTPGTYSYFCTRHAAMAGTITVTAA